MHGIARFGFATYQRTSAALFASVLAALPASAAQIDIVGPSLSQNFGGKVAVLPNGNIVVADYKWNTYQGAVYLYSPTGVLISTLTGSNTFDQVGSSITMLKNGNFVVSSPYWNNNVGEATLVNSSTGVSGAVSATNSLVGSVAGDYVGAGVTALSNGNYVVSTGVWHNAASASVGAVTWANGSTGLVGTVTAGNSLIGSQAGDGVGGSVAALSNGNYVVISASWHNGANAAVGAVTWVNGGATSSGVVSTSNSLSGSTNGDAVGNFGITELINGNYVVSSGYWQNSGATNAGAVTWGDGNAPLVGVISNTNSLVGTLANDSVGGTTDAIVALSNGNYVVASHHWSSNMGAATWANGSTGITGTISASNSLIGTTTGEGVSSPAVTGLTNGNYVVPSPGWNNGTNPVGAATWANGTAGLVGTVTALNSLTGSNLGDGVGSGGVTALANGNYVVASPSWSNGISQVGAATWCNGSSGLVGTVSTGNSLTGSMLKDRVGEYGAIALSNGNYVVMSPSWNNGGNTALGLGAATWVNGSAAFSGAVSAGNSLIGSAAGDRVAGRRGIALNNGNYVVQSPSWNNGGATQAGAVTWGNGSHGLVGTISMTNSLVGGTANDQLGLESSGAAVTALVNGNYAVIGPYWDNGGTVDAGAASLGRGNGGTVGPILDTNSVRGTVASGGAIIVFAYDPARDTLVVGQPKANIVSLFKADLIFKNGFD